MWWSGQNFLREERERGGVPGRRVLVSGRVFLHEVPRLALLCRIGGHRPVVAGTDRVGAYPGVRWVQCSRCGRRGEPQGRLPAGMQMGGRYTGPWGDPLPGDSREATWEALLDLKGLEVYPPGPLPAGPTPTTVSAELHVGDGVPLAGFRLSFGGAGDEQAIAGGVYAGRWFGLHVSSGNYGRRLAGAVTRGALEGRAITVHVGDGFLCWDLLTAERTSGSRSGSGRSTWRAREVRINLLDRFFGTVRWWYDDVAETARFVLLPEGEYLVGLRLQRQYAGRPRGRRRTGHQWCVQWDALGRGLPTEGPARGRVFGSAVTVSPRAVRAGTWPAEAVAAIGLRITEDRSRDVVWDPVSTVPVLEPLIVGGGRR